jgi:phage-related protein
MDPSDWKPMPSVGGGVQEIRIHSDNEYRIIYLARLEEVVYVLHAFEKKTRRTPQTAIEVARRRLQLLLSQRRRR